MTYDRVIKAKDVDGEMLVVNAAYARHLESALGAAEADNAEMRKLLKEADIIEVNEDNLRRCGCTVGWIKPRNAMIMLNWDVAKKYVE